MKIAFICTEKLPIPPILGGAIQIYIQNVIPYLSQYHNITVFSLSSEQLLDLEFIDNIRHKRISGKTKEEYINNVKEELAKEKNYDLIHVFNRPLWVLLLSTVAPGSAFSLSLHNEMFLTKKIEPERAMEVIERVEFITTVSNFIADELIKLYPSAENKITVVYSAVDTELIKPYWDETVSQTRFEIRSMYHLEDYKIILNVTRLCAKKGSHILLAAMKRIMEQYPKTALVFVGSKWYGSNTTDDFIIRLQDESQKLAGPVIFTGFLPPSVVPEYYNAGDIFVCASQWREPLARVHYEAMAAGLPIITTDRGGNAEVIDHNINGLVLKEYNNPFALAKEIEYLLNHEDHAKKMGEMGRKTAIGQYNFKRVAFQLNELFMSIKSPS